MAWCPVSNDSEFWYSKALNSYRCRTIYVLVSDAIMLLSILLAAVFILCWVITPKAVSRKPYFSRVALIIVFLALGLACQAFDVVNISSQAYLDFWCDAFGHMTDTCTSYASSWLIRWDRRLLRYVLMPLYTSLQFVGYTLCLTTSIFLFRIRHISHAKVVRLTRPRLLIVGWWEWGLCLGVGGLMFICRLVSSLFIVNIDLSQGSPGPWTIFKYVLFQLNASFRIATMAVIMLLEFVVFALIVITMVRLKGQGRLRANYLSLIASFILPLPPMIVIFILTIAIQVLLLFYYADATSSLCQYFIEDVQTNLVFTTSNILAFVLGALAVSHTFLITKARRANRAAVRREVQAGIVIQPLSEDDCAVRF
ncbi:hypothetical protein J8273_6757 [Carpediemonas membranifera]|uniref:Uncharacterized protein n=1 Tax=Carpediemonas membranifera TaxID=201153 RepID=A0A8J6ATF4_9EUKA|nr:hypothetical protein J8273_6757 [Carpediemonas membranifera]|eukprot:KAG9391955.1 hypothetical protein J8273_6757 [Carpediemonas membranifera]